MGPEELYEIPEQYPQISFHPFTFAQPISGVDSRVKRSGNISVMLYPVLRIAY